MILCMIVQPKLLLYSSNETSLTFKALISSHLRGCRRCQQALEQLKKTTSSLRDFMSIDVVPGGDLDARILDSIRNNTVT